MPDPTVTLSPDVLREDGKNRVASTAGQAGAAGSLVVVALWIAEQVGWNGTMPSHVVIAFTGLLTGVASVIKNRRKLAGKI